MTTVLSVTTPPIVWPKKRASAASGTIIKEQEWAVHIKQHNGPRRATCMGTTKGEEEENRLRGRESREGRSRVSKEWEGGREWSRERSERCEKEAEAQR